MNFRGRHPLFNFALLDLFFFGVYRYLLIPVVLGLLTLLRPLMSGKSGQKVAQMLDERKTPQRPALVARPIWIHAASGEIEYAKPVIRALKERYPQIPILVTYFSPSAHKLIKSVEGIDAFVPLPWDHRGQVKRFLEYAQPLVVMFARTDVWPELGFQLRQQKVPTLLFSATLAGNSSRVKGLGKFLARFALNCLDQIFCVNAEDEREFKNLGVTTPVQVLGDTRFDQALFRLQNAKPIKSEVAPPSGTRVFVIGSSWPQDEEALLGPGGTIERLIETSVAIVWAPHEVHDSHLQQLEKKFASRGWDFARYTQISGWGPTQKILLIDEVGILPEIYTWGDFAFVGGSFKDRVHSVMEPLAAGLPVLVGPHYENNREALHFALKRLPDSQVTLVSPARDAEELANRATAIMTELNKHEVHSVIENEIHKCAGVTEKLLRYVPNPPSEFINN